MSQPQSAQQEALPGLVAPHTSDGHLALCLILQRMQKSAPGFERGLRQPQQLAISTASSTSMRGRFVDG